MDDTTLESFEQTKFQVEEEIYALKESILNTDNEEEAESWEIVLRAKQLRLKEIQDNINRIKREIRDQRLKQLVYMRGKNSFEKNNTGFEEAKKDAEEFVFQFIALPAEDIARYFSTKHNILEPIPGSEYHPHKLSYRWFHDVRKRANNKIPLSPNIEPPKKLIKQEWRKIDFLFSKFYGDPKFIQRCQQYYQQFSLQLSIQEDKQIKFRFWIELKVGDKGLITF